MVLHADKTLESVTLRGVNHPRKLPGKHGRRTDIPRLAGFHYIGQCFHGFFDRRHVIEAMDLIEVNVIRLQAGKTGINGMHDVLARETALVGIAAHGKEHLGSNDQFFARLSGLFERAAKNPFALTKRVHVGRVKEVDAQFQSAQDEGTPCVFFQHPLAPLLGAIGHGAQAKPRNFQASCSEINVFHG